MFRITRVFENETMCLYKVEGKLTDDHREVWEKELNAVKNGGRRQIILDLSQLYHAGLSVTEKLIAESDCWYLLNCSIDLRNRMISAGRGSRVLG